MNILLLGPQGSGKGTQAEMLSKKIKIPLIATGDIFRRNISRNTKLGKIAAKYINQGHLVPDEITNDIITKKLLRKDVQRKGFILDGYPRNLEQAMHLSKLNELNIIFEIHLTDEEAIKRIGGRRTCKCGAVYHIKFNPPNEENICDKCGGELFVRDDDKKEHILQRMRIYHKKTKKILPYYKKKGVRILKIDGSQNIQKVHEDMMKAYKKMAKSCS